MMQWDLTVLHCELSKGIKGHCAGGREREHATSVNKKVPIAHCSDLGCAQFLDALLQCDGSCFLPCLC